MNEITIEELRFLDLLVRGARPISPVHEQWDGESRRALSGKLARLIGERVREPVRC